MESRNGFSDAMSTVGTLLLGAFIGASIALLMAPKAGSELRSDLAEASSRMGETLSEAGRDVAQSVKSRINQLGSRAEAFTDNVEGNLDSTDTQ